MMVEPIDPIRQRVADSFAQMPLMATLGARLAAVQDGRVSIELPFRREFTQQHGYVHAGVVASIADTAGGYAALTTMDEGASVLAVEFKINLLRPAEGVLFVANAEVVKSGRTLTVTEVDVYARDERGSEKLCARMQQTCIAVTDRPEAQSDG